MTSAAARTLHRFRQRSGMIAAAGFVLCLVGFLWNREQFFRSYLLGYLLWIGIALGALALLMIHTLTGGGWGRIIRPALVSAVRTLPLFVVLFLPIVLGARALYLWADPEVLAVDGLLRAKSGYLNITFFIVRAAVYFVIWIGCARLLQRLGAPAASVRSGDRARAVSAPGLVLYGLSVTLAAVDWVMSLEPHWYSTIYGMSFAVGQVLSALAFAVVMLVVLSNGQRSDDDVPPLHDLGNLLLAFVMLWAYLAFSQYLIIWSANLPSEIEWYVRRGSGGWRTLAAVLMVFHFAVPFLLLLSRSVKRHAIVLAGVALGILLFRWVDLFWITAPAFHHEDFVIHWMDLVAPVTLGALWMTVFAHVHGRRTAPDDGAKGGRT